MQVFKLKWEHNCDEIENFNQQKIILFLPHYKTFAIVKFSKQFKLEIIHRLTFVNMLQARGGTYQTKQN